MLTAQPFAAGKRSSGAKRFSLYCNNAASPLVLPAARLGPAHQGALKMLMLALVWSAEAVVTPRRLAAQATGAPRIAAGFYHTCGIRADTSRVECWG